MFTYSFGDDGSIILTNNKDMTIVQRKNPYTQEFFKDNDDAIAWAKIYAGNFGDVVETPAVSD